MDNRRTVYGQRNDQSRDSITSPRRDPQHRISKSGRDRQATRPLQLNSLEDEQTRKWVSEEDAFVLKQAKKKAVIRVREGRPKPIDWLAVILRVIDPDRDLLDDDEEDVQMDVVDPEGVFEGLTDPQFAELEDDITSYLTLETNKNNQDYWRTMRIICNDRRQKLKPIGPEGRAVNSVATDVDKLLGPKSYEQLEALEKQIRAKLSSDDDIDVDYWEHLLKSLLVWKAKAKLKRVYQSVLDSRLAALRRDQVEYAQGAITSLSPMVQSEGTEDGASALRQDVNSELDPQALLTLKSGDKTLPVIDESSFLAKVNAGRVRVLKLGYVPMRTNNGDRPLLSARIGSAGNTVALQSSGTQRPATNTNDDNSKITKALYDREAARGIDENEEVFTTEESEVSASKPQWADKYRPRKPRYFNRVQMGYEWNKYNQTHYDQDNPPPKVVQGYKFNIFYPDLIDKTKAPTFKIIREGGRKRGESFAPAGEEDTCLIRFIAGPPYIDLAFRIVDKEWDYSAKYDRGFRSSFDKVCTSSRSSRARAWVPSVRTARALVLEADMPHLQGILSLHFQFKKVCIRTINLCMLDSDMSTLDLLQEMKHDEDGSAISEKYFQAQNCGRRQSMQFASPSERGTSEKMPALVAEY